MEHRVGTDHSAGCGLLDLPQLWTVSVELLGEILTTSDLGM